MEPIEFSFDAPTWSLGKSMAAQIAMGHIGKVYHKDLKDTVYQICGRRDEQWEIVSTRRDWFIVAFIQELNQHIRWQENQMCASMIDLKKAMTRIMEVEEELKSTRDGYEEEIAILVEKNDDLTRKLGVFMGDPARGGEDDESKEIRFEDYMIIDDTDSDPDNSDDDYVDEAGADIMESLTDQYFESTTISVVVFHHVYSIVRALL